MGSKACAAVLILALSPFALTATTARAEAIDPTLAPNGNAAHGEVLFKQRCAICHQADPGGKNMIGPLLYGAFGRKAGEAPGFTYSEKLKTSSFVWTPEKLNQWIQKPTSLVPGAKMVLAPVSQAQDRADIIAFLRSRTTTPNVAPAGKSPHELHEEREHAGKHRPHSTKS